MSDHKTKSIVLSAVVAALVLLSAYVGAYYAMVTPVEDILIDPPPMVPEYPPLATMWEQRSDGLFVQTKSYNWWRSVFAPIHWLDRRTRPRVWEREFASIKSL